MADDAQEKPPAEENVNPERPPGGDGDGDGGDGKGGGDEDATWSTGGGIGR